MSWVSRVPGSERFDNILSCHSLNPTAQRAHIALYRALMFGESPLTRVEREAVAACVSAANNCHYWVTHHGEALGRESGDASLAETVVSGRFGELDPRLVALCRYALRLTRSPSSVERADLELLRGHGLDDRAIVDLNQVVAYFNYVNRIAEGLGVELESRWPEEARVLREYRPGPATDTVPQVAGTSLPWLTVAQMREVDRLMVDEMGIDLPRMMENAGRSLAELARLCLHGELHGKRIVVLAGPGGNGGGGLVAARHLANAGAVVRVALGTPETTGLAPVTSRQLGILAAMGVTIRDGLDDDADGADLVIDAMLGYGQTGSPRERAAGLIAWSRGRRVVALDVPSGLELSTGTLHEPHVSAEATLTLALPKKGLRAAPNAVGELFLADISVPAAVYRALDLSFVPPFSEGPIVRLRR